MGKRVLVCGGRDFKDWDSLCATLMDVLGTYEIDLIIHGGARGADKMAQEFADSAGICCMVYPADWKKHKKAAGVIRNQIMLTEGKPDLVVAFPGGDGTADMIVRAEKARVPVIRVPPRQEEVK